MSTPDAREIADQELGVAASPPGCQPTASAADASSRSGIPNAAECIHLPDYAGEVCRGCGDEIDGYGNTENDFRFCSFPDCGCDGARLCMAGSASDDALGYNVEGMYRSRDPRARMRFIGAVYSGEFASGIEAATADETRSGSAVGESPATEGGDAR